MWKLKQRACTLAVVVEAVHHAGRNDEERPRRQCPRAVAEVEREGAVDDEEPVRVLGGGHAAPLPARRGRSRTRRSVSSSASTSTVARRPGRSVIVVAVRASRSADDDEPGIGRHGVRRGPLIETRHLSAHVVAVARARRVEDEESRLCVARHLDRVHDLGRDECPALRADPTHAILESQRELSVEHVQRLAVSGMDVRRRLPPSGSGAHLDRGELLDVGEERHVELPAPEDDLACADLEHGSAA